MRLTKKEIEEHLEPFQTAPSFLRFIGEDERGKRMQIPNLGRYWIPWQE